MTPDPTNPMSEKSELKPCQEAKDAAAELFSSLSTNWKYFDAEDLLKFCEQGCQNAIAAWNTRAYASPWVKVSERLPQIEGPCIVAGNEKYEIPEGGLALVLMSAYFKKGKFFDTQGYALNVTHWHPMPKPPAESDQLKRLNDREEKK